LNATRFHRLAPTNLSGADRDRIAADRALEDERWRKARSIAVIGTVLLHFLALILFRESIVPVTSESAAEGPAMGDVRPAGGGSGLTMVDVRVTRPQPPRVEEEVPVPVPVPVVEPEEVVIEEEVEEPAVTPELPAVAPPSQPGVGGSGTGGQGGTTSGPGTGSGDGLGGGGNGDGGASTIIPPTPRGIFIPPPGRPASARGQEITVWVFVSAAGRVDRRTVRLEPPTSDSRYNQRLIESVSEWVFDPARQGGQPVPVWYPFQIIL
jgi:hypothetical protein